MAEVHFRQVLSYPASPEANTLYFLKRTGGKADLRLTDSSATYYSVAEDSKVLSTVITGLNIVNGAIVDTDTILAALGKSQGQINAINTALADKVDKITGKGLSTNDYSNTEKDKVSNSKTITDLITITQAVDLDDVESKANSALQNINGITAGGDLSGTYPNPAILNSAVLAKLLTGLNVSGSTILATDNLLQAFGKLQSQLNAVLGGAIYQSTWNATTNSPTLADGTGTKGHYYVVSVAGTINLGSGNIDFQVGDWAIHNGTIYQKVDNTDAVSSVNGFTGAVNLTSANISEVTNLYFTNARAIASVLTGYTSGAGVISATDSILSAIQKLNGNIAGIVQATDANLATIHHAATAKSNIVDADEVTGGDSANSFGLIRTTWTSIKAFLKTYNDTLYQPLNAALNQISGLTPSNDDILQRKSGSWVNRTIAQLKSDLNYTTAGIPDSTDKRYVTDAQLTVLSNTSGVNSGDQNYNGIADFAIPVGANQTATGPRTNDLNAGATVSIMELLILDSSSKWQKADANALATYAGLLSIALANGTNNNPINVALKCSIIRNDSWAWTPGAVLYMSETAGAITETAPTSTDSATRVIGYAIDADTIYFDPSTTYVIHT